MKSCIFLLVIAVNTITIAQPSAQMQSREIPTIGVISGTVLDQTTGQPIEYANVVLINRRDSSLATGGITDAKGNFRIENIRLGRYRLKVSFMGYQTKIIDSVTLNFREPHRDFGKILLVAALNHLDEVEVITERQAVEASLDKKIYNVDKMLTTTGGTAIDVLQQIPSVNVDVEGNISLRGSTNFTVLIDGKPSGMMANSRDQILAQIPANAIDRIEVVTTPSARYDAEGTTGIINIVLKKNKLDGLNGSIQAGIGTGEKYDASANLNYRYKKLNTYASYSYRYDRRYRRGRNNRFNTPGDTAFYNYQNVDGYNLGQFHNLRAGFDYDLTPKFTLGHVSTYNSRKTPSYEIQNNFFRDENLVFQDYFIRSGDEFRTNQSYDGTLSLKYKPGRTYQELSAELTYSSDDYTQDGYYQNQYFFADGRLKPTQPTQQKIRPEGDSRLIVGQVDYAHPLKKSRLETGFKITDRSIRGAFFLDDYDTITRQWVANTLRSNDFKYQDRVSAGYASIGTIWLGLKLQTGLRAEYTQLHGELITTGQTFTQEYLSFFPSLYLVKEFKASGQEISFNYSRRISRPNARALNPFIDYSDPINLRTGNPSLQPEFTHSLELSYLKQADKYTLNYSIFVRRTDNSVSRFRRFLTDTALSVLPGATLTTLENIATTEALGIEANLKTQWSPQIETNLGGSWNYNRINAKNLEANLNNSGSAYNLRLMASWKPIKNTSLQLTGNYNSARPTPQGSMRPIYGMDLAIRREFLKAKNLIVTLNLSDIFDTRQFQFDMQNQFFQQDFMRKRETRVLSLSVTYRIGKQDFNQIMRRSRRSGGSDYNAGSGEE